MNTIQSVCLKSSLQKSMNAHCSLKIIQISKVYLKTISTKPSHIFMNYARQTVNHDYQYSFYFFFQFSERLKGRKCIDYPCYRHEI